MQTEVQRVIFDTVHQISNGKYKIPGLPAVYAEETESQTLEITMEDVVTGVSNTSVWCTSGL